MIATAFWVRRLRLVAPPYPSLVVHRGPVVNEVSERLQVAVRCGLRARGRLDSEVRHDCREEKHEQREVEEL